MAENVTLARPYAEAAFQLAKGAAALPAWSKALGTLAAVSSSAEMQSCISDPRLAPEQLAQSVCRRPAGYVTWPAEQQNFVRVLVDNDRLQVLPEIASLFEELKNAHEGVRDANVESAFPLDAAAVHRPASLADLEKKVGYPQDPGDCQRSYPNSSAAFVSPSVMKSLTPPCAASLLPWQPR